MFCNGCCTNKLPSSNIKKQQKNIMQQCTFALVVLLNWIVTIVLLFVKCQLSTLYWSAALFKHLKNLCFNNKTSYCLHLYAQMLFYLKMHKYRIGNISLMSYSIVSLCSFNNSVPLILIYKWKEVSISSSIVLCYSRMTQRNKSRIFYGYFKWRIH